MSDMWIRQMYYRNRWKNLLFIKYCEVLFYSTD